MRILRSGSIMPEAVMAALAKAGHDVTGVGGRDLLDPAAFRAAIADKEIYIAGGLEKTTTEILAAAKNLKAIIFLGTDSAQYIDGDAAKAHGVPIYTTPHANAAAVAEYTLMLILMGARRAGQMLAEMSAREWRARQGFELQGRVLGLVGAGAIAERVAKLAAGFGMEVLYTSRGGPRDFPGKFTALPELLVTSEIVSLHLPQAAGEVLGAKEFAMMERCQVLVNTARAALVNAQALVAALAAGRPQVTLSDVFYTEGPEAWSAPEASLLALGPDKFVQMPHAGWATAEASERIWEMALAHIAKVVAA